VSRRQLLEAPHADDYARSVARRMTPPHNFAQLIGWFLSEYRAEIPARLHVSGVWRDQVTGSEADAGITAVGGSLLGTPRPSDPFRAYIEDSPFATETAEYEGHKDPHGHYRFPLRAALAKLAGRGRDVEERPFMARCLYRTATRDGDWNGAAASLGILEPVRRPYVEAALWNLWRLYRVEPDARPVAEKVA
jgi:hypothetical protein